jgi:hypothetical protein
MGNKKLDNAPLNNNLTRGATHLIFLVPSGNICNENSLFLCYS